MLGEDRRLATELVVMNASATQEIHGTAGLATAGAAAAEAAPVPPVLRGTSMELTEQLPRDRLRETTDMRCNM
jgi:DNA-binding transcriptional regulator YdaS (Cro superfamily)